MVVGWGGELRGIWGNTLLKAAFGRPSHAFGAGPSHWSRVGARLWKGITPNSPQFRSLRRAGR